MTLTYCKVHTDALLLAAGEAKTPELEAYTTLLHQQLQTIASNSYVLKLETQAEDFEVLREISEGIYIRIPYHPEAGNSEIDIDEELVYAASNMVASLIARKQMNKEMFIKAAFELTSAYDFKIYETLKMREEEDCP